MLTASRDCLVRVSGWLGRDDEPFYSEEQG
jgi:hypothetical protein